MATLVHSPLLKEKILYVKGAPEIVLSKCREIKTFEGYQPINEYRKQIEKQLLDYQNQAMRTLGFAYKIIEDTSNASIQELVESGLTFWGIVAISDPVRTDVPDAVAECLNAWI